MPSFQPLPPELICMIVDHHRDELQTLRQCSLVAKAFRAPAQKHIFEAVDIIVDCDDAKSRRLYRRFCNVASTNPTLLTYVRELAIVDNSDKLDPPETPRPSWIRDEADFPGFFKRLVNLEWFVLTTDLYWNSLPPALRAALMDVFHNRNITYLGLQGIRGLPKSCGVALKNIRELLLWNVEVDDEEEEDELVVSPLSREPARLEWFSIESIHPSSVPAMLDALVTPFTILPALTALCVGPRKQAEVAGVWEVMKTAQNTLTHFSWIYEFNRHPNLPPFLTLPIDLSTFKNLQNIVYHVTYSTDRFTLDPFAGLLSLLKTVNRENVLRSISLKIDYPNNIIATGELSNNGWNILDQVLDEATFKRLETVSITVELRQVVASSEPEDLTAITTHTPAEEDKDFGEGEQSGPILGQVRRIARMKLEGLDRRGKLNVFVCTV